jgi:6-phosphogluconolactonase/glucosamine-6-phosphate isomerase/deaminase
MPWVYAVQLQGQLPASVNRGSGTVYFVDGRIVPRDNVQSNYGMVRPEDGSVQWFLDTEAASLIHKSG